MGFDTSDNCLLGRPRALDAMLAQVRLQPCVLEAATLRARGCSPMPSRPRRDSGADWGGSPTSTSLYLCMLPLCCPSAAAPTHTQFVNDSSYSRVYAALGAGARAQGRAHLPELQLKVGHSIVYSIVHHMDMVCSAVHCAPHAVRSRQSSSSRRLAARFTFIPTLALPSPLTKVAAHLAGVPTTMFCHPDALAAGLALSARAAPPGPLRARLAAEHARRAAVAGKIRADDERRREHNLLKSSSMAKAKVPAGLSLAPKLRLLGPRLVAPDRMGLGTPRARGSRVTGRPAAASSIRLAIHRSLRLNSPPLAIQALLSSVGVGA